MLFVFTQLSCRYRYLAEISELLLLLLTRYQVSGHMVLVCTACTSILSTGIRLQIAEYVCL